MINVRYSHEMIHQKIMYIICENSETYWLCYIYLNEKSVKSNFLWHILETNMIVKWKWNQMWS